MEERKEQEQSKQEIPKKQPPMRVKVKGKDLQTLKVLDGQITENLVRLSLGMIQTFNAVYQRYIQPHNVMIQQTNTLTSDLLKKYKYEGYKIISIDFEKSFIFLEKVQKPMKPNVRSHPEPIKEKK